jgi:hypothetical protein
MHYVQKNLVEARIPQDDPFFYYPLGLRWPPIPTRGFFPKHPVELARKMVLIDIEVIEVPLDYNILLGCRYMYTMKEMASFVFHTMIFPHNGKVVTIDKLTHYEPHLITNLDNILPLIGAQPKVSPFMEIGIFQDPLLLGIYQDDPPCIPPLDSA